MVATMNYNFSDDVRALNPDLAEKVGKAPSASKYHNAKTEAENLTFQSGREAAGVQILILLEKQHKIFALRLGVRIPLAGGIFYVADAVYLDNKLDAHIIDFKAWDVKTEKFLLTPEFKLKQKLFEEQYSPHKIELV